LNDDKYNGAQIKARVFLDRLKEARDSFINDFLQPEIKRISKDLGFRSYPTVRFQEMDLRDEVQLMRVATRLMELGIVTAEQGRFPDAESLDGAQDKFVEQRKKGYFNPIVGGIPMIEDDAPVEPADEQKVPGEPGRPIERDVFSRANIQDVIVDVEKLHKLATAKMKEKINKKRLTKVQKEMIDKLCEAVVCGSDKEHWDEKIISCVKDYTNIESLGALEGVLEISDSHKLEIYPSAILYHSNERN
jgi:hypothetical protein